jgi:gamma-glutamyl phosphate reductase
MTTISMDTCSLGMAVRGRTIYYCTGYKGLKMLNLSDRSVSDIISSSMSSIDYVATSGDKLYYAIPRGDNHDVVSIITDDVHVPIIVHRDTTWTL